MTTVYTSEYLSKFEVLEEQWRDDKTPDARKLRDARARELRKAGWTVTCGTYDYTDLGRFVMYWLNAERPKPTTPVCFTVSSKDVFDKSKNQNLSLSVKDILGNPKIPKKGM